MKCLSFQKRALIPLGRNTKLLKEKIKPNLNQESKGSSLAKGKEDGPPNQLQECVPRSDSEPGVFSGKVKLDPGETGLGPEQAGGAAYTSESQGSVLPQGRVLREDPPGSEFGAFSPSSTSTGLL